MKEYPKISIVTPSYNQGQYLEETILSIIGQGYPNLEYIIIDGGSTDGSVDIIRKYARHLAYWISEPDKGQYDAINKGFSKATGEIMGWLNSDDKYLPWTFNVISEIFLSLEVQWLTTLYPLLWDTYGRVVGCSKLEGFNRKAFLQGRNLPKHNKKFATCWIQQESTFWRRRLWEQAGSQLKSHFKLAGDFELWARFWQYADLFSTSVPLGGFRSHPYQKTATQMEEYYCEAEQVLSEYGYSIPLLLKYVPGFIIRKVPKTVLKNTGLLYTAKVIKYYPENCGDSPFFSDNNIKSRWRIYDESFI